MYVVGCLEKGVTSIETKRTETLNLSLYHFGSFLKWFMAYFNKTV